MDRRLPALFVLLVGLVLVLSPAVFFQHAGQQACVTNVERIDEGQVPADASVIRYGELSPDAKRAFEKARNSPDGVATVYGERCPERFTYSDTVPRYFVQQEEAYYQLETYDDSGLFAFDLLLGGAFALVGALLVGTGGLSLVGNRESNVELVVLGVVGAVALVLKGAGADFELLFSWTALAVVVSFVGVGLLLRDRHALLVGGVVTLALALGFEWLGWTGSVVALSILPLLFVGVGVGVRRLSGRVRSDYSS